MKSKMIRPSVVGALLCLLDLSGCALLGVERFPTKLDTYRAVVSDESGEGVDRLKEFDNQLKLIVGASNLETRYIGCTGCSQLTSATPPPELEYIFFQEHTHHFRSFTRAWHAVQVQKPHQDFSLQFDAVPPEPPACVPTPCYNVPSCTSTDGCDKNKKPRDGCQPC